MTKYWLGASYIEHCVTNMVLVLLSCFMSATCSLFVIFALFVSPRLCIEYPYTGGAYTAPPKPYRRVCFYASGSAGAWCGGGCHYYCTPRPHVLAHTLIPSPSGSSATHVSPRHRHRRRLSLLLDQPWPWPWPWPCSSSRAPHTHCSSPCNPDREP